LVLVRGKKFFIRAFVQQPQAVPCLRERSSFPLTFFIFNSYSFVSLKFSSAKQTKITRLIAGVSNESQFLGKKNSQKMLDNAARMRYIV